MFNASAYAKIRPHLISGVVTKRRNLFYVQDVCHVPQTGIWEIIRASESVSAEDSCITCTHRLRFFTGACGFQYHARTFHVPVDLLYLTEASSSLHMYACPHLESYLRLSDFPQDNTDEYVGDWSFSQYLLGIHLWRIVTKHIPSMFRLFGGRKNRK